MAPRTKSVARPGGIAIDFSRLPKERLQRMADAGAEVMECHRVLANSGDNIVGELLKGVETFYQWDHYPAGDVYDHESHSQFYYHAHPQDMRGGEHGHFHTFLRPHGMPPGIAPLPLPDYEAPADKNDALSHLIAISMDKYGLPIRLFSTNRWVTGETWYAAGDVVRMLDRFVVDHAQPSWPVNRWISAMIRLFHPQIGALLESRDARLAEWKAAHPGRNAYEDRDLEITSVIEISVDDQIRAARGALSAKP